MDNINTEEELLHEPVESVILRSKEYGKKFKNEIEDEKVIIYEEYSDESEIWDCESIISNYSNLDNHPGKIYNSENRRKKKIVESVLSGLSDSNQFITLKGREKLPVDFFRRGKKAVLKKIKEVISLKNDIYKRKKHGEESKEEKKEQKVVVKEKRREARRMKKETKEMYKGEAQRAQKVAAFAGPLSIHLM